MKTANYFRLKINEQLKVLAHQEHWGRRGSLESSTGLLGASMHSLHQYLQEPCGEKKINPAVTHAGHERDLYFHSAYSSCLVAKPIPHAHPIGLKCGLATLLGLLFLHETTQKRNKQ